MKSKTRVLFAIGLCFVLVTAQSFANGKSESATKGTGGIREVRVGISFSEQKTDTVAWEAEMEKFSKIYGPAHNMNFKWIVAWANGDPVAQAANVQDLISQHVDIIVERAQDGAAVGASIEAAHKAGIPFVTFDRQSMTSQPDAHVGGDSFAQGLSTAMAFADLLEKNGIQGKAIELMGDLKDANAVARSKAWHQVEDIRKAWTTVQQIPTEWKAENFYTGIINGLAAHPEANCIFVASDWAFDTVVKALQQAGRLSPTGTPNHFWVAAQDVEPEGYNALLKGYIDVDTEYDIYGQSDALVTVLGGLLSGEKVQGVHLVAGPVITAANVKTTPNLWAKDYMGK